MNKEIYSKLLRILKEKGFKVFKIMNEIFDIYAVKDDNRILIKIFEDAISLKKEQAEDLKKFSLFLKSFPVIVSNKYKGKILEFGGYKRYGILVLSINGFVYFLESFSDIRVYSGKIFVRIDSEKVKEILKRTRISDLSRRYNLSKYTIFKYIFYKKCLPLQITEDLEREFGINIKVKYKINVERKEYQCNISKILSTKGAEIFELEKYSPRIYGNIYNKSFGIIEREEEIDKARKFSKIFNIKFFGIEIEDKDIIKVTKEDLIKLKKEDLVCLLS